MVASKATCRAGFLRWRETSSSSSLTTRGVDGGGKVASNLEFRGWQRETRETSSEGDVVVGGIVVIRGKHCRRCGRPEV
ncbi:hypothetical protein U1Q18_010184 [Sarracenia purpurea var. burkii]